MNNKTSFLRMLCGISLGFLLLVVFSGVGSAYDVTDDGYIYAGGYNTSTYSSINKYLKSDMSYVSNSTSYGGTIRGLIQDDTYVYAGGTTTQTVRKYLKSDMSYVSESPNYGGSILAISQDATHVYAGGDIVNDIKKYLKSDMSYVSNSTSYGGNIYVLTQDDTYVYAGGDVTYTVRKYLKSNMSYVSESPSYGSCILAISHDVTHIYAGGWTAKTINKYLKSDMSYVSNSTSYGGGIYGLTQDATHVYAGGDTVNDIKKYLKSDMSYVSNSTSYGDRIQSLTQDANYVYVGGDGVGYVKKYLKSNLSVVSSAYYSSYIKSLSTGDYTPVMNITSWGNNYTNNQVLDISIGKGTTIRFNVTTNINTTVNDSTVYSGNGNFIGGLDVGYGGGGTKDLWMIINFPNTSYGSPYIKVGDNVSGTNDTKTWNVNVGEMDIITQWNNYTNSNTTSFVVAHNSIVKFNVTANYVVDSVPSYSCGGGGNSMLDYGYYLDDTGAYLICQYIAQPTGDAYITVGNTTYGNGIASWTVNVAPTNDDFDSATVISAFTYNSAISTLYATKATDDPSYPATYGHSVWYKYTASVPIFIEANTFGSNFDTVLGAYTGTRGSLTQLKFNDNYNATTQSYINFTIPAGQTIYFMAASYDNSPGGNLNFTVSGYEQQITSWGNNYTNNQVLDIIVVQGSVVRYNVTTNFPITSWGAGSTIGEWVIYEQYIYTIYVDYKYPVVGSGVFTIYTNDVSKTWNVTVVPPSPPSEPTYNRINHTLTYTAQNSPSLLKTNVYVNGTKVNEVVDYTIQYYNIYPEADTWIGSYNPNTNYGSDTKLKVHADGWITMDYSQIAFKFNNSMIPSDEYVINTNLVITKDDAINYNFLLKLHAPVNNIWNENTLTWNNRPWAGEASIRFAELYTTSTANGTIDTIDITNYAKNMFNINNTILNFIIMTTGDVGNRNYASKENTNTSRRPYINVTTIKNLVPTIPGNPYTVNLGSYLPLTNMEGGAKRVSIRVEEVYSFGNVSTYVNSTSVSPLSPFLYNRYGYNSDGDLREDINIDGLTNTDVDRFNRVCQEQTFNLRFMNANESFTIRDEDTQEILYNYISDAPSEVLIDYKQQIGRPGLSRYGINKVFIGKEGASSYIRNSETYRVINSKYKQTTFDEVNVTCVGSGKVFTPGAAFAKDSYTFGQDVNVTWQGEDELYYGLVYDINIHTTSMDATSDTYLLKNFTLGLTPPFQSGNFKAFNTEDAQVQTLINKGFISSNGIFTTVTNPSVGGVTNYTSSAISDYNIVIPIAKFKQKSVFISLEDLQSGFGWAKIALFLFSLILMFTILFLTGKHLDESDFSETSNHIIQYVVLIISGFIFMLIGWIPFEVIIVIGVLIGLYAANTIMSNKGTGSKGGRFF